MQTTRSGVCASRESDELNNFHSCKRREAAYDGKRTNKYTDITETLYFNLFWSYYIDGSTRSRGGAVSKHIYLGETRLATVINDYRNVEDRTFGTEKNHIYFYHSDPAMFTGEYIPDAGKGTMEEGAKLPGMGGVFNHINGNLYHYAGNNPIKYTDPDGRDHGIPAEIQKILDKQNLKNNIKNKVNDISKTIGKIASRAVADEK